MNAVQQTIRILVVLLLVERARAQDGYSERDMLRFQQMAAEGQLYGANVLRDPAGQPSSVSLYHVTDNANNDDYHRADRTRTRKVYRIKNPFQNQLEDNRQDGTVDPRDSSTGASNQYASMQYSLPPDEFLQQMRAESQFYQQSTPAPSLGYTATPQPQYQYSTISPANYDSAGQASQVSQLEAKSHSQYLNNAYQYNPQNSFPYDSIQSTPSPVPPFISTVLPSGQFVSTPSNSYVSSASSIFLSSPPNLQYVSSPLSAIQTGSPDYGNNRVTTTIGNNVLSYDSNDQNKKLQIDHYDNSANGIRYPINVQRQYQNEYGSSTVSPSSTPDPRDQWQNNINTATAAPKSLHDIAYTPYQNYPYNEQDHRANSNVDHVNTETHRMSNVNPGNNIYMNYIQPEYQVQNNVRARTRDLEQQIGQPDYYSNGEYGWKVDDKKQPNNNDAYSTGGYRYQVGHQSDNGEAVSQMNFHMDTSKQYSNYDQSAKSTSESIHAQEFAKAAARAQENMKQQQSLYENNYDNNNNNYNSNNNNQNVSPSGNPFYNNYDKQKIKYESPQQNNYYNQQQDLITASPYFYSRDNNIENRPKPTFDHAKALKNIVPIDVSNVVSNSDSQKGTPSDANNRFLIQNYERDAIDRQQYRQLTDTYFKDKNAIYGFNIKTKPDEYQGSDSLKLFDPNPSYYGKQQQTQEQTYNQGVFSGPQRVSYVSQPSNNMQDSQQSPANIQQHGILRPTQMPTDINGILKLNDVPYHLTQNVSPDSSPRFSNLNFDRGNIPSPLPVRLNQDVGTHHLDAASNLLSKLILKQPGLSLNRPDLDTQAGSLVSTINGFKVANPYNVDLKLVADVLKGKSIDELPLFRDQYSKPSPLKFDLAQLQQMLKNENMGLSSVSDQLSFLSSPFLEIYNGGRPSYPYQKYSRSQEEEEPLVPIADASSNHPIGAVMEQDDPTSEREGSTGPEANSISEGNINSHDDERPKKAYHSHRSIIDRHRHPNSLMSGRYQRRYPKSEVDEPYPLLKPPPPHSVRGRGGHIKHSRRRRVNKSPKIHRIMKAEPLFEAESDDDSYESPVPVLRPPAPVIESKSDTDVDDNVENSS